MRTNESDSFASAQAGRLYFGYSLSIKQEKVTHNHYRVAQKEAAIRLLLQNISFNSLNL
ncbi:hypothetical protein HG433_001190 [Candidatus Saccharibacteria bacterium]|nr:hypothetical protein [Candidatus Saccharibacteria bacterium]